MLEEWGPAGKLADRQAMTQSPPAVELAVRVTTKLTFSGAGHVVRQDVSLPAGATAGIRKRRVRVDDVVSDRLVTAPPGTRKTRDR